MKSKKQNKKTSRSPKSMRVSTSAKKPAKVKSLSRRDKDSKKASGVRGAVKASLKWQPKKSLVAVPGAKNLGQSGPSSKVVREARKSKSGANVQKAPLVNASPVTVEPTSEGIRGASGPALMDASKVQGEALVVAPIVSSVPPRAPVRKIVGAISGPRVLEPVRKADPVDEAVRVSGAASAQVAMTHVAVAQHAAQNGSAALSVVPVLPPEPIPQYAWTALPEAVSSDLRALASFAAQECVKAANWPFPFARFIAALPTLIGGVEFSLLALDFDENYDRLAAQLNTTTHSLKVGVEGAKERLLNSFSDLCVGMYRQWTAVLGGAGIQEQALIERYRIEGVDAQFQALVGCMVLRALGARNPMVNGKLVSGRWTLSRL